MKIINILVAGPEANLPNEWWKIPGEWVGVDLGATRLFNRGIKPIFVVGDFDSVSENQKNEIQKLVPNLQIVNSIKDDTDTELALQKVKTLSPDRINLFGATGGRLDHEIANIWMIVQKRFSDLANKFFIYDYKNEISYLKAGVSIVSPDNNYKYIGFMALNPIENFVINGAKYKLHDFNSYSPRMFTSNEFIENKNITVSFKNGIVMVIKAND
ncbi:MAG: thiamine diphosphokinase [Lactobacillaceae bacterium]|jgi:thiamine pyrophosphokinase|nr:thiamine diphosphokinase [Lactobacillaceae bacterium]